MTTIKGIIERVFHASSSFSAGTLKAEDGRLVRFRGRFCANYCDAVALTGDWKEDPVFGPQFEVTSVSYELPHSEAGLSRYLAQHPGIKGIGEASAKKLVKHAGSAERLEELLQGDLAELGKATRVKPKALVNLKDVYLKSISEIRVRSFLASFQLSHRQVSKLMEEVGEKVVGILKKDPYQLIQMVDGYGFKKVDEIALKMHVPRTHPGRIAAGLRHALREEVASGHTWTLGGELVQKANTLLGLGEPDGIAKIRSRGKELIEEEILVSAGAAVAFPRMLDAERIIQKTLKQFAWREEPVVPRLGFDQGLQDEQVDAYQAALRFRISVLTGGAGTGKTTIVSRLAQAFRSAGLNVALCAPTGKAAKRIQELLEYNGVEIETHTIHRLLKYNGTQFQRDSLSEPYQPEGDADEEPAYDAVIVDESSMVDILLFADLLQRIDFTQTRLLLVGDHNQLPPVGAGNVLRDILAFKLAPSTILTRVHRQAGILKTNSVAVLSGTVHPSAKDKCGWIVADHLKEPPEIQAYVLELVHKKVPDRFGLDPLREIQVLTPTHKGPLGTKELNGRMQRLFHGETKQRFVVGDKVIQTVNDYELEVMNGEVGWVRSIEKEGMHVEFEGRGMTYVTPDKQGDLQLAYALTVHKAQGSEFPCVILVIHRTHFYASRPLLYTGVTRAAQHLILVGDPMGIRKAALKNEAATRRTFLSRWHKQGRNTSGEG